MGCKGVEHDLVIKQQLQLLKWFVWAEKLESAISVSHQTGVGQWTPNQGEKDFFPLEDFSLGFDLTQLCL